MDDHHIKAVFNTLSRTKEGFNTAKLLLPSGLQGRCHCCLGFGQAQLTGDQAGKQGVAEGSEGLGLLLVFSPTI